MAMPALPFVTAFYAALTGLLCVVLASLVIRQRMRRRISVGDGGDAEMLEICHGPRWLVHALGATFIVSRLAHAFGLAGGAGINPGRSAGIVLTLLTILVASIALLAIVGRKIFV